MPPALIFAGLAFIFGKYRFWSGKSLVGYVLEVAFAQSFQFLYYPVVRPILLNRFHYEFPPALTVSPGMFIGSLILGLFGLYIMHRAERSITNRLENANELVAQLKNDRKELVNLDEAVRRQTSRFLHDRVQSDLMVVGMKLKSISGQSSDEVNEVIERSIARLENSRGKDLRDLINTLSPNFDIGGLQGSLKILIKQYESNMSVSIEVDNQSEKLDSLHQLGIYRIIEQALLNSFVHGPAKNVLVTVSTTSSGATEISIADDGPGTDLTKIQSGVGSAIIESWVGIIGGKKTVDTVPGHGYRLVVNFPA
jgi:signal transduction histidine kinase